MDGQIVYMVCDTANIDQTTGTCTQVQYVQAPSVLPPLSLADGSAIALAIWGLWACAAAWRSLS